MNTTKLDTFVHEVMAINATIAGMGGSYSGIMGTSSPSDQAIYQLKKTVIALASEYRKKEPQNKKLAEYAEEIETLLNTLQITSVISNSKYEQLITDLKSLSK